MKNMQTYAHSQYIIALLFHCHNSILELPLMHICCMVDTHFGLEKYPYLTSFLKELFSSKKILGSIEFAYIQHLEVNIQGTTISLLTPAATLVL